MKESQSQVLHNSYELDANIDSLNLSDRSVRMARNENVYTSIIFICKKRFVSPSHRNMRAASTQTLPATSIYKKYSTKYIQIYVERPKQHTLHAHYCVHSNIHIHMYVQFVVQTYNI